MGKPEKPGELEFYTQLVVRTYQDAAARCDHRSSSIDRDVKTLKSRSSTEGMGLFLKALPSLGKCFDKALSSDVPFSNEHSFELSNRVPRHPRFMGAFWRDIFSNDGMVAPYAPGTPEWGIQCHAVRGVRQVCYLLYKLRGGHPLESEAEKLDQFVETDQLLPGRSAEIELTPKTARALESARTIIDVVLKGFDPLDIRGGHGPGSVATGEKPWEKMNFSRYYEQIDRIWSYSDHFFANYSHLCDHLQDLEDMETCPVAQSKVTMVPKDARGPRVISMEPLEIQWIQQGLKDSLYKHIERPGLPCTGKVNFTDQQVNRRLAQDNSYYGDFVTADMKEASDRVSVWLVEKLFPPHISECLFAARSSTAVMPDGRCLELRKFAPMGSATCFPTEALTFWALAVASTEDVLKASDLRHLPDVFVFGDDLVLRKEQLDACRPIFRELFLEFNEDKCCTGRFFRESCGMDAFKFQAVNPVRVKARWSKEPSPAETLAYLSYVNSFEHRGYTRTADFLRKRVDCLPGPNVPRTNTIGVYPYAVEQPDWDDQRVEEHLKSTFKTRYNTSLQRHEVKVPECAAVHIKYGKPGWSELFRIMMRGVLQDPFGFEPEPLRPCGYTVPRQTKTRWKWVGINSLLAGTG